MQLEKFAELFSIVMEGASDQLVKNAANAASAASALK
jgi:hypothetical protein